MSKVKVSCRAEGNIMILDRDTSDAYVAEDQDVIEEVSRDAQILADQLDNMIEVHVTTPADHHALAAAHHALTSLDETLCVNEVWPSDVRSEIPVAPATPRTSHMSFAECFAALKEIVGDRADRTLKIEVTAWQHNAIPDTEMNWSAWVGSIGKSITAPTPESLVARVRAAIDGSEAMTLDEVRT